MPFAPRTNVFLASSSSSNSHGSEGWPTGSRVPGNLLTPSGEGGPAHLPLSTSWPWLPWDAVATPQDGGSGRLWEGHVGRKPRPPCGQLAHTVPEHWPLVPTHARLCVRLCRASSELLISLLLGVLGRKGTLHPLPARIRGQNSGPPPTAAPRRPSSPRSGTTPSSCPHHPCSTP